MPNDAKLGLVAGVGLVIVVTVVFFRKDPATANPPGDQAAPAAVNATAKAPSARPKAPMRPAAAPNTSPEQTTSTPEPPQNTGLDSLPPQRLSPTLAPAPN